MPQEDESLLNRNRFRGDYQSNEGLVCFEADFDGDEQGRLVKM